MLLNQEGLFAKTASPGLLRNVIGEAPLDGEPSKAPNPLPPPGGRQ